MVNLQKLENFELNFYHISCTSDWLARSSNWNPNLFLKHIILHILIMNLQIHRYCPFKTGPSVPSFPVCDPILRWVFGLNKILFVFLEWRLWPPLGIATKVGSLSAERRVGVNKLRLGQFPVSCRKLRFLARGLNGNIGLVMVKIHGKIQGKIDAIYFVYWKSVQRISNWL